VFIVCDRGDRYLSTGVFPHDPIARHAQVALSIGICPQCATALAFITQAEDGGDKERLRCPACGFTHWNNPVPVLAAVIEYDGQILLARNAAWPGKMYALITGFMEAGETPQEGIAARDQEETSLHRFPGPDRCVRLPAHEPDHHRLPCGVPWRGAPVSRTG
jgi:ribosomal protein S27AE